MDLPEYRARELFASVGIPVPDGYLAKSVEDIKEVTAPVVLKSQVLTGGRGKAGGIRFATTIEEARKEMGELLGLDIKGHIVEEVLVVEKVEISREIYLAILIDRSARLPLLLASAAGGMEIEDVSADKLVKIHIDPWAGYQAHHSRILASELSLSKDEAKQIGAIAANLWDAFVKNDSTLIEINPLAVLSDGRIVAADGKLTIDDDALFRHPEFQQAKRALTPLEAEANAQGIAFIQLDGEIGVIANGAGLTMATLDNILLHGGTGGVFLDLGGTDSSEQVTKAFELMLKADPPVILMNIFGGITKCDTVAQGVKDALDRSGARPPVVARIKGLHEEEGRRILADAGLHSAETLDEAGKKAVELLRQVKGLDDANEAKPPAPTPPGSAAPQAPGDAPLTPAGPTSTEPAPSEPEPSEPPPPRPAPSGGT